MAVRYYWSESVMMRRVKSIAVLLKSSGKDKSILEKTKIICRIYLIKEAYQAGDKVEARKLHQRAKRRVNVRIADVDKALKGVKSDEKSKLEEI